MLKLLLYKLLLLIWPLVLRLTPLRRGNAPWRSSVDLPLLLGGAILATTLSATYFHAFNLGAATTSCDAVDVCVSVGLNHELSNPLRSLHGLRQPGAALLPSLLGSQIGLINGLALGAILSAIGTVFALGLWARALFGRAAGVSAMLMTCSVGALVVQSRHLTFYPEAVLGVALSGAGAAVVLRWRNSWGLFALGTGVGIALFMDHLGLVYGAIPFGIGMVVVFLSSWKKWPQRMSALWLPLIVSFSLAHFFIPPSALSFEQKLLVYMHDSVGVPPQDPDVLMGELKDEGKEPDFKLQLLNWSMDNRFWQEMQPGQVREGWLWGHSGPIQVVKSGINALFISRLTEGQPVAPTAWDYTAQVRDQVKPWLSILPFVFFLTLFALRRRPLEAVGFVITLLPYLMSFLLLLKTQVWPKTMMAPSLPIPVMLGIVLVWLAFPEEGEAGQSKPVLPIAVAAALSLFLVMGWLPSHLGAKAPWRTPFLADEGVLQTYHQARLHLEDPSRPEKSDEIARLCEDLQSKDIAVGHTHDRWIFKSAEDGWDF